MYIEPFAGSLAVLLANPHPAQREVACDMDGLICNFWRAIRSDPEAVAHYADYPTIHQDLTARHRWLVQWAAEHSQQLSANPLYFDAQAAGWWVWGISIWIGGGWCTTHAGRDCHPAALDSGGRGVSSQRAAVPDTRPNAGNGARIATGQGCSAQRESIPDTRPHAGPGSQIAAGQGVSIQRQSVPGKRPIAGRGNRISVGRGVSAQRESVPDKRPQIAGSRVATPGLTDKRPQIKGIQNGSGHGTGVSAQRQGAPGQRPAVKGNRASLGMGVKMESAHGRLIPWFHALAERLARVIVLNRDWQSAVTPTILADTATGPGERVNRCIFLDPPYRTERRKADLYKSDVAGNSDDAAVQSYEWAVKHGDRYRVAYCCHSGDFPVPPGWEARERGFSGHRRVDETKTTDLVMFSPACRSSMPLFD